MAASYSYHELVDEDCPEDLSASASLLAWPVGRARRDELSQRRSDQGGRAELRDPRLYPAFRRFYVWRDAFSLWHAKPMPKVTAVERARRIPPELTADSLISLAILCIWHRNRRASAEYF